MEKQKTKQKKNKYFPVTFTEENNDAAQSLLKMLCAYCHLQLQTCLHKYLQPCACMYL